MKTLTNIVFCFLTISLYGQTYVRENADVDESFSKANLGIGIGLDYGGIGGRLSITPSRNFGLFGGVGYAIAGVGYNVGLNGLFNYKKRAQGYLTGMYGYNAALLVTGTVEFKKLYYGITFGGGLLLHSRNGQNYWNFGLLIPIRDPEFQNQITSFQNQGIDMSDVPPIGISVGYHIKF